MYKKIIIASVALILGIIIFSTTGLDELITSIISSLYSSWFEFFINSNGQELLRQVNVSVAETDVKFDIAFVNPNDVASSTVKSIVINMFNEFVFPMIVYFTICSPFIKKQKLKSYLLFSLLFLAILFVKNILQVYDNYSYPEYALVDLGFPSSKIVYYYNSLIENVGYSLNLMIVAVFWFINYSAEIAEHFLSEKS